MDNTSSRIPSNYLDDLKSRNGFARERALKNLDLLAHPNDRALFLLLLERINDWVQPVRQKAEAILTDYISLYDKKFLIELLPDVYHLRQCKRNNLIQFIEMVEEQILADKEALLSAFQSNEKISRCCYVIIKKHNALSKHDLIKMSHKIKDITIKREISTYLVDLDKDQFIDLESVLLASKNKDIRRETLRLHVKYNIDKLNKIKIFLFDKSKSVVETAYYLANKNGINPCEVYEDVIRNYKGFDMAKVKIAIYMLSFLEPKAFCILVDELIHSMDVIEFKSYIIKCMLKIDKHRAKRYAFKLSQLLKDDSDVVRISCYFNSIFKRNEKRPSLTISYHELYENILNAETIVGKKAFIELIPHIFNEWERLLLCLNLYNKMGEHSFIALGVQHQLIHIPIAFRNDDVECEIRQWTYENPVCLKSELYNILSKSWQGNNFLETLVL